MPTLSFDIEQQTIIIAYTTKKLSYCRDSVRCRWCWVQIQQSHSSPNQKI